jgi:indole-3-glycerol phosphate synthase
VASTRLEQIVDAHRLAAASDTRDVNQLVEQARSLPGTRGFEQALRTGGLSVIAEVKRRSPSVGDLDLDLEPAELAKQYESGGASCVSVLTDVDYFGGSVADLQAARAVISIPVLRKDFTVDERDVIDARIMGADAILLIVAALSDDQLRAFSERARELDLGVLVEVHDEVELQRAIDIGATIIGVNQRNLHTFEIDRSLAARLSPMIPDDAASVAESGIRNAQEAHALAAVGYDAVLVGTSLVTSEGPEAAISAMVGR